MSENEFEARILPRRMEGDVEHVHISFGAPVEFGGGDGAAAMMYQGYTEAPSGVDYQEDLVVPFASFPPEYISGFEVEPGALSMDAPKGAYLVQINAGWAWADDPDPPPLAGYAYVILNHVSSNAEEPESPISIPAIELVTSTTFDQYHGDYPFAHHRNMVKIGFAICPWDGHFEIKTFQNVQDTGPMELSVGLAIVKL